LIIIITHTAPWTRLGLLSKLMAKWLPMSPRDDYSGQQPTHFMDIPPVLNYRENPPRNSFRSSQNFPILHP